MPDLITDELVLDLDTAIEYFGGAYPGPLLTELRTAVTGLRHPTLVPDFRPLVATGLAVDRQSPNGGITHQLADALQQSLDLIAALNAALIRAQEEIAARSAVAAQATADGHGVYMTHAELAERDRRAEIRGQIKAGGVFATSGAEERWCKDQENDCPVCGGSGHKDDAAGVLAARDVALVAETVERAAKKVWAFDWQPDHLLSPTNFMLWTAAQRIRALVAQHAAHPDDIAVDRFAIAMKAKLAKKRADGRGGWEGPDCTAGFLSQLLREHVEKGDPVDVGNLAMMLHQRGERIEP